MVTVRPRNVTPQVAWLTFVLLASCLVPSPIRGQEATNAASSPAPDQSIHVPAVARTPASAAQASPTLKAEDDADGHTAQPERPRSTADVERELAELRRRIEVLADELERMRSGEQERELSDSERQALGLAPSAAATYRKQRGVSLAGYGEMLFENPADTNESGNPAPGTSQLDYLRLILYTGYRFTDRLLFNSEIEIEHANEVSVELAYLDWMVRPSFALRGGMVLVPLGLVNEFHEPTVFLGAKRSETESRIIPTTWRENGVGALGSVGRLNYRAYVVSGLDAAGFGPEGLRGGRQKGSRSKAADLGLAARVDFAPTTGTFVGAGLFTGGADQGQIVLDGRRVDVTTTIVEAHGQALMRGFDLRGLFAWSNVTKAGELSRALNLAPNKSVAEIMQGGYVQVGYNVLSQMTDKLWVTPYYRFEVVDTQKRLAPGFVRDLTRTGTFNTLGVEVRPLYSIVLKADYQWLRNDAGNARNQFNVNLGYAF